MFRFLTFDKMSAAFTVFITKQRKQNADITHFVSTINPIISQLRYCTYAASLRSFKYSGGIKPSLVLNKEQTYDHQKLYTCMVSILRTQNIRLSNPASPSIRTHAESEFAGKYLVPL